MGLRGWLARFQGPKGYGIAMGRPAREWGSALAIGMFVSHGIGPNGGPAVIFDTKDEMKAAGFTPVFEERPRNPIDVTLLNDDERLLLKSLTVAMIAFAFIVNSNAALQYMQRDNTSKFRNGLGPSLLDSMVSYGLFDKLESARAALLSYTQALESASISTILNRNNPADGDVLEYFIARSVEGLGAKVRYGFCRTGTTGFDVFVVPLAEETLKSILAATHEYKWGAVRRAH